MKTFDSAISKTIPFVLCSSWVQLSPSQMWGKLLNSQNTVKAGFLNQTTFFLNLFCHTHIKNKIEKTGHETLKNTL